METKSAFVRELQLKSGKRWQGVIKTARPNPEYIPPAADGSNDTRTLTQRRSMNYGQMTKLFPESVRTKSQANAALAAWRAEVDAAQRQDNLPGSQTFVGDYVSSFVDDLEASGNVERVTISDYRNTASKITKAFPTVKLADLTRTMIQKWENKLSRDGYSPATVIKYHRLLSQVCEHAVTGDELLKNPCKGVRLPKRTSPSPNALTMDGYARLANTLDKMEPTPVVIAATIALYTGMREGEVCGLHWKCYDEERGIITVEESIGKAKGGTYSKAPKTKSSKRSIPVSAQLAIALERRRRVMVHELEQAGITLSADEFGELYILGYVDGRYFSPVMVSRNWQALSRAFGLIGTQGRAITFHDLRHSFATYAIAKGIDVRTVSAILGHASTSITLDVYADADPENKRRAIEQISRLVSTSSEVYDELSDLG